MGWPPWRQNGGSFSLIIMGPPADILQVIDLHGRLAWCHQEAATELVGRTAQEVLDALFRLTTNLGAEMFF